MEKVVFKNIFHYFRNCRPEVYYTKDILKIFAKFRVSSQ